MTQDYYQQQAESFFNNTIDVDMSPLYQEFLSSIPAGGHVVDAGCGSGRDSRYFSEQGFDVTAFDASSALVELAKKHTGLPVLLSTFSEFSVSKPVDGIWACASLLHVPFDELTATFKHLAKSLKTGGVLYCSFKYGAGEVTREGRHFTNLNEELLTEVLQGTGLTVNKHWQSGDQREGRENERWLNAILVKN